MDDLNTLKAIAEMHRLHSAGHWGGLRAALGFLGFSGERAKIGRTASAMGEARGSSSAKAVGERIAARNAARSAKDFKEADRIRDELAAMGITLKDAKDPKTGELTTTWEVAR